MTVRNLNSIGGVTSGLSMVALGGALMVGGCVDSNSRTTLGDGMVVETFTAPRFPDPRGMPSWKDDGRSLVGLARENWASSDFLVPVDGTRHRPHYASNVRYTDVTERQRGEYPTVLSSLYLDGSADDDDQARRERWAEVVVAPANALWELILIPFNLVYDEPQDLEAVSPDESYARRPENRRKMAAPALHPEEEATRRPATPEDGAK